MVIGPNKRAKADAECLRASSAISSRRCSSSSFPACAAKNRDSLVEREKAIRRSMVTPIDEMAIINKTSATPLLSGAMVVHTCAKLKLMAALQNAKKAAASCDVPAVALVTNYRNCDALRVVSGLEMQRLHRRNAGRKQFGRPFDRLYVGHLPGLGND